MIHYSARRLRHGYSVCSGSFIYIMSLWRKEAEIHNNNIADQKWNEVKINI